MTKCSIQDTTIWNDIIVDHYKRNKSTLLKKMHYLGDGAEDVVHDAYERCLKYASSFNGQDFDRWFYTILRNAAKDYRRQERGQPDTEDIDEYDHIGASCDGVNQKMWNEIFILIDEKPPQHAEVLNLYFNNGYSYKDIAAVTDNTYFNAYRIVSRFKAELVKKYKE